MCMCDLHLRAIQACELEPATVLGKRAGQIPQQRFVEKRFQQSEQAAGDGCVPRWVGRMQWATSRISLWQKDTCRWPAVRE